MGDFVGVLLVLPSIIMILGFALLMIGMSGQKNSPPLPHSSNKSYVRIRCYRRTVKMTIIAGSVLIVQALMLAVVGGIYGIP